MAKAKKPASSSESAPAKAPAKKRATRSKKTAAAPAPAATPLIDTGLAAESAARMLLARQKLHIDQQKVAQTMGKETPTFKQLKETLTNPAASVSSAMGSTFGEQKSNLPIPSNNQVAHNQTTSGVGRVNVPRRTAG